jgi:exosortase B
MPPELQDTTLSSTRDSSKSQTGTAQASTLEQFSRKAKNRQISKAWLPWGVAGIGLALVAIPTLYRLLTGVWASDEQGHGPIVLGISLWLTYGKRELLMLPNQAASNVNTEFSTQFAGWLLLAFASVLYALGRSQSILSAETLAIILILIAFVLLLRDTSTLKALWFPIFFMLFLVPLPGVMVAAVTQPLKTAVSIAAEWLLYNTGYPISRTGVILQIGPYQLLVADACAGLHTLFTLEALGMLYLNLVRHSSALRNITLAILIVPISFCANVIRVVTLTLVTYYLGDEAGQGFLHGFAGMVLFLSALLLIIATDRLLRWGSPSHQPETAKHIANAIPGDSQRPHSS